MTLSSPTRYYGFWAGVQRKEHTALARKRALAFQETLPLSEHILLNLLGFMVGKPNIVCPLCQRGSMIFTGTAAIGFSEHLDTP